MKGGKSKSEIKNTKLLVNKTATKAGKKLWKAAGNPKKLKRPSSAFFVFLEEFRVQFKKDHPENKSVAVVGKASGDKWKSMSDSEKAPYVSEAEKRKAEYEKKMKAYNKGQAEGPKEEELDKLVSEVNDEEEEEEEGRGEDEDDD